MQIESRSGSSFTRMINHRSAPDTSNRNSTADVDVLAASIVIGLTAVFVVVLFAIVTGFISSLIFTTLLGTVTGASCGLIAHTLMRK